MRQPPSLLAPLVLVPSLLFVACVPQGKFDAATADAQTTHDALRASLGRERSQQDQLGKLGHDLDDAQAEVQARDQKLSDLSTSDHNLQAQLDQETAIDGKLRDELQRLGKNVDQMLLEKGTLAKAQVAGHTDNVPINTPRFPSNWELSTARAVEVVKLLVAHGIDPRVLSAAGYGEFDPIASNETAEGLAKNRRIEITLQPNLDELVTAPVVH